MKKIVLFAVLLFSTPSFSYKAGIRLAWDYSTLARVYRQGSTYARVIRIGQDHLLCVFEYLTWQDGNVAGFIKVSHSYNDGASWEEPITVVSHENGINPSVPDIIKLQNGWIMASYNPRPPKNNSDEKKKFAIKNVLSKDNGQTWEKWSDVYNGSHLFVDGVWEPSCIQLESGEIQLFFANEFPYQKSGEQEITMFRSRDNGQTWYDQKTTSFRPGHRDGMPAPLILKKGKGIVVAIEDGGWDGIFKPSIVYTSVANNWNQDVVGASSPNRWRALKRSCQIPAVDAGAAPYITQIESGETILSYQGTEGRRLADGSVDYGHPAMWVAIGDDEAKNFSRTSLPFRVPSDHGAWWNSVFAKNAHTVTAVSNLSHLSGVHTLDAHIMPQPEAKFADSIVIDGQLSEEIWQMADSLFVGAYSPTGAWFKTAFDNNYLYIAAKVRDSNIWGDSDNRADADDAIIIFLDKSGGKSSLGAGHYQIIVDVKGERQVFKGNNGSWQSSYLSGLYSEQKIDGTLNNTLDSDQGYTIEVQIPWFAIGGKPADGQTIGFNLSLIDDKNGALADHRETISSNKEDEPATWCGLTIGAATSIQIEDENGAPKSFKLDQNYPNPFNPQTTIAFEVPSAEQVRLEIFTALGRKVRTVLNQKMSAGKHTVEFNAANLASGLYLYQIQSGSYAETKKFVLLK